MTAIWTLSEELYKPRPHSALRSHACKDPSIVRHEGRWHLFTTVRDQRQNFPYIEYAAFSDWASADQAERHVLPFAIPKFAAPQIFYYRPQQLWYLVFQMPWPGRGDLKTQAVFSTNTDINNPRAWTDPKPFFLEGPDLGGGGWLDFWVMGDGKLMYLFYTGCNGFLGMTSCAYDQFPHGFGACKKVIQLRGDDWHLFEAAHLYKVKEQPWYIAIIEGLQWSKPGAMRFFQLFATRNLLSGNWHPIQVSPDDAFAHATQCAQEPAWTANISHGECIRSGVDERLEIDNDNLRMLIQGVDEDGYKNPYIKIPWRLGMMTRSDGTSLSDLIESRLAV